MREATAFVLDYVRRGILNVHDDGSIWRVATLSRTGRILPLHPARRADTLRPDGYRCVRAGQVSAAAHRIAWLARHGDIPEGKEINHRNGDRGDNSRRNLELVTKGENLQHSYAHLGRVRMAGSRNGRAVLTAAQVAAIRSSGLSARDLGRKYGVSHGTILLIRRGVTWHAPDCDAVVTA